MSRTCPIIVFQEMMTTVHKVDPSIQLAVRLQLIVHCLNCWRVPANAKLFQSISKLAKVLTALSARLMSYPTHLEESYNQTRLPAYSSKM